MTITRHITPIETLGTSANIHLLQSLDMNKEDMLETIVKSREGVIEAAGGACSTSAASIPHYGHLEEVGTASDAADSPTLRLSIRGRETSRRQKEADDRKKDLEIE